MKTYRFSVILFLIILPLSLAACSAGGEGRPTTLIYANLTENGVDRAAVNKFNATHEDVQIEVRDYFDENGWSGKDRLLSEMALGKVPDIIDLGEYNQLPYSLLARKDYLTDLWPFIENDPELGREGVVEAPLKAAEIDGGLYVIFNAVDIQTVVGTENIVGDRKSWTLQDLMAAFSTMPEGSTILDYFTTSGSAYSLLFRMSIEEYVNWETGECSFTSEKFKTALQFTSNFLSEAPPWKGDEEENTEIVERILGGYQMLDTCWISRPENIQLYDAYWGRGGRAAFIGYPVADGSVGSAFSIYGKRLAMSSVCKNKEAAWEFMRTLLLPQFETDDEISNDYYLHIPINRTDYDVMIKYDTHRHAGDKSTGYYMGPELKVHETTEEELERFEDLLNSVERIDLYDMKLFDLVWEIAGPYFAGDWTLDKTVDQIQRRVKLYVDEQR